MTSERLFGLLLRACPVRIRERFGPGMRYAWATELEAARANGTLAVAAFWIVTTIDTLRFAAAERTAGVTIRGRFTIDWRDAWRALRAAPMVSGFAVVSLALGIGGVTALFSILNSLALRPLPVHEPQRLALFADNSWTNPIWEAVRDRRQRFAEDAFAWGNDRFNLSPGAAVEMADGFWVSGNMFEVLGVRPAAGRLLIPSDDLRGGGAAGPVAVISHGMWERRYGAAPDIVGRTLLVERVPFTIVGVAEKGFFGPDVGRSFDVALPLGAEPLVMRDRSRLDGRTTWWMNIMARLRPGQSADEATRQLRAIQPEIRAATLPEGRTELRSTYLTDPLTLRASPGGRSPLRARYERPLTVILGVFALVLVIACANVANLLIARASDRRHELTVRLALGASRARVARQLFLESLCLGAAGAGLGIVFAHWGSRVLVSQLSSVAVAIDLNLQADWRVVAFAALVTVTATVLFGVAPALAAMRIAPHDVLKEHGRGVGLPGRAALPRASVVVQVALSLSLVAGAGLFARTFLALERRDLGLDRGSVILVGTDVGRNPARGQARIALFSEIVAAVQAVPGVASASVSFTTPVARAGRNIPMQVPPDSPLTRQQRMSWVNVVAPGWFETIGIRLLAGRDIDARDTSGAPPVAVVNRAFASRFLAGVNPVGERFFTNEPVVEGRRGYQIVGLVEDSVYRSVRDAAAPTMYVPLAQDEAGSAMTVVVRPAVAPSAAFTRSIAAAIERQDREVVLTFRSLDDQIAATLTQERVLATVAVFLGGLGLLLAGIGLYGVTSQAVTSRRAEIGLRMALGASAHGVVRIVMARIAALVGIGIAAGFALSAWAATYVSSLLYGLEPRDPATFAGAAALLAAVAAIAAWVPARRASRIDPIQALRS